MGAGPRIDRLEKNYLINGSFRYFQRGGISAPITINNTGYQTADRWSVHFNNTVTLPNSQRGDAVPLAFAGMPNIYNLRFSCTSGSSTGSGNIYAKQRIESVLAQDLVRDGKMSLSVQVGSECAGRCRVIFYYPTAKDNFASTVLFQDFGFNLVTSVDGLTFQELKIENVTVPGNVSNGLEVWILFDNWTTLNTANQEHRICVPMLNAGATALPFSHAAKDMIEELQLCQRYYEKSYLVDEAIGTNPNLSGAHWWNGISVSNRPFTEIYFKVSKRTTPTVSVYNPQNGILNSIRDSDSPTDFTANVGRQGINGFAVNPSGTPVSTAVLGVHWIADAEL